ncbi:hypothetical protein GR160_15230 [Flavobacterium sp. Sd200]|uniref:hypothetical protein n=1 Tax=Flavobacterium sp. Sd200 TaxID=2692211 RepID=UPI00136FEF75|nr:hypothetical protein [Flavobacterium sp. Sd200]MXN92580.1 hypothetical protein [Flavobacterium sp. Sd200]
MGLKVKKEVIYGILFFACVGVPYLGSYELTFGVWSLTTLLTVRNKYSLTILQQVGCFASIFLIALCISFFHEVKTYEYIRDITYMVKPILGLLIGYQLCKDYMKNPLGLVVNTGILIAIAHLLVMVFSIMMYRITDMHKLREYSGYFSDYEVYALIILLFRKEFNLNISGKKYQIGVLLLSVSIALYLARTNFIQLGIFYLALKGYFRINKRSVIIISTLVFVLGASYAAIYSYNPKRGSKGFEAFLYKIKIAPTEPFKTKVRADDWKDFHDNYRSYETILTLRQVPQGGVSAVLFGEGMGSSIDLKRKVWLQTSLMRYIPFLHNGFMTVFLKSGLIGDIILIISILLFFRHKKTDDSRVKHLNYLMTGTGLFLVMSYWVFMGLYFVPDSKSVIIGFLIRYRENVIASLKNPKLIS